MRAVTEHRDDMVRARTQLINRLHAVLVKVVPSGLTRGLSADAAAEALRRVRPRNTLGRTLRTIASTWSQNYAVWTAAWQGPRRPSRTP